MMEAPSVSTGMSRSTQSVLSKSNDRPVTWKVIWPWASKSPEAPKQLVLSMTLNGISSPALQNLSRCSCSRPAASAASSGHAACAKRSEESRVAWRLLRSPIAFTGDYTVAPAISRIVDCVATHLSLDCRSRIDHRSCHIGGDMRLPFSPPCLVSSSVHVRPCCALHAMRMRRHRASTNIPHSPDSRKTWLEHHRCPPQVLCDSSVKLQHKYHGTAVKCNTATGQSIPSMQRQSASQRFLG